MGSIYYSKVEVLHFDTIFERLFVNVPKNVSGSSNSRTRENYSVNAVFSDKNYSKRRDTKSTNFVYRCLESNTKIAHHPPHTPPNLFISRAGEIPRPATKEKSRLQKRRTHGYLDWVEGVPLCIAARFSQHPVGADCGTKRMTHDMRALAENFVDAAKPWH